MKPLLRWPGGKAKLVPKLVQCIPAKTARYVEPMCGAAALFFALERSQPGVLCDLNTDLINAYRVIRDRPAELVKELKWHEAAHKARGKEHYYKVVEQFNCMILSSTARAAQLVYLNKACYNGLWRVNKSGAFNTPMGKTSTGKPPVICDEATILAASRVLAGTELHAIDVLDKLESRVTFCSSDFVYFDPPYDPASKTANFTSYTKSGFGVDQHKQLAALAARIRDTGACVVLSLSDTPLMRDLYAGWELEAIQARRSISCKGDGRKPAAELIVRSHIT